MRKEVTYCTPTQRTPNPVMDKLQPMDQVYPWDYLIWTVKQYYTVVLMVKNWFVIFMQCIHCISFDTTRWQQTQFIFTGVCLTLLLPTTAPFHLLGMTYSETSSEKLLIRCYGELYFVGRVITLCSFTIRWKHCNQGYTTRSNRNIFHNNSKNWPPTEEKCVYFAPNVWHV